MAIDASDLQLPARDGACILVLTCLGAAAEAADRLSDGDDASALHDFRVAVRRLRGWLRAFDDELRDVRPRDVKRLHKIGRATSPGRDLEVQLEWLHEARRGNGKRRKAGADWVAQILAERQAKAARKLMRLVDKRFHKVRSRIASVLDTDARHSRNASDMTLGRAIAQRVREDAPALRDALDQIHTITDEQPIHHARITAKRLRYLLEPVAPHVEGGDAVLTRLKALQDDLGVVHDRQVMACELADLASCSGSLRTRRDMARALGDFGERIDVADETIRDPAPSGSLLAVAQRLRRDIDAAFAVAKDRWLGDAFGRLDADITTLVDQLLTDKTRASPDAPP